MNKTATKEELIGLKELFNTKIDNIQKTLDDLVEELRSRMGKNEAGIQQLREAWFTMREQQKKDIANWETYKPQIKANTQLRKTMNSYIKFLKWFIGVLGLSNIILIASLLSRTQ